MPDLPRAGGAGGGSGGGEESLAGSVVAAGGASAVVVASAGGAVVVAAPWSISVEVARPGSVAPRLPSSARAEKAVASEAPMMKSVTVRKVAVSRERLLFIAELPGWN